MNQVYICADFSNDGAENVERATKYASYVYGKDMIPIAPALYSGALNLALPKDMRRMRETRSRKLWNGGELWVFGDRITPEMREEIRSFQALNGANAKVRYISEAELNRFFRSRHKHHGRKYRRKR